MSHLNLMNYEHIFFLILLHYKLMLAWRWATPGLVAVLSLMAGRGGKTQTSIIYV